MAEPTAVGAVDPGAAPPRAPRGPMNQQVQAGSSRARLKGLTRIKRALGAPSCLGRKW